MAQIDKLLAGLRTAKDRKDWVECVELCREASALASATDVDLWYPIRINLALSLLNHAEDQSERDRSASNIDEAIGVYESLLALNGVAHDAVRQRSVHRNLAYAYSERVIGDKAANLSKAISHYKEALCLISKSTEPVEWAEIGSSIGLAYSALVDEGADTGEVAGEALPFLEGALEIFTKEDFPNEWTEIRSAMGRLEAGVRGSDLE